MYCINLDHRCTSTQNRRSLILASGYIAHSLFRAYCSVLTALTRRVPKLLLRPVSFATTLLTRYVSDSTKNLDAPEVFPSPGFDWFLT
jgi:hypothetical protein